MTPQLTPKFWIIRAPDGELSVRAAKFEHVTDADIRKHLLSGWVIEATIEAGLASPEMQELYKAVAALDNALGARMPPHLRDMIGELVLLGYKACKRELEMSGKEEERKKHAKLVSKTPGIPCPEDSATD